MDLGDAAWFFAGLAIGSIGMYLFIVWMFRKHVKEMW